MRSVYIVMLFYGALSGCYVSEGRLCGVTMPEIYCDKEGYGRLARPVPLRDFWRGVDGGALKEDWVKCGGDESGWYSVRASYADARAYNEVVTELHGKIQDCMLKGGYKYSGVCNRNNEHWPACRE